MKLFNGDCLKVMADMADNSCDAIVTDPPYYGIKSENWDNQWANANDYLAWLEDVTLQWRRILKPNGSLYCFAWPRMAAKVEIAIGHHFNILNSIVWEKQSGWHKQSSKESLRAFFPASERIIFAGHFCFLFEPIRAYLATEWKLAGFKYQDANIACGTRNMAGRHYFCQSQWQLPTREHYESLVTYANSGRPKAYLLKEYDELHKEYETLRRAFSVTPDIPYTDVWHFDVVSASKTKNHLCEKPQALLQHILQVSTKPGAIVLDCFMGGGSMGEACQAMGREFIGIESDTANFQKAESRLFSGG